MKRLTIIFLILLSSCTVKNESEFSEAALNDVFITLKGDEITFQEILDKHFEKKIVLNIWASWCGDCIRSLPGIVELKSKYPDIVYINLSLDKSITNWKLGIENLQLKGEQYYMKSGWEGPFGEFLHLSWIPRYLVVDKNKKIIVFNATKSTDELIEKSLKK